MWILLSKAVCRPSTRCLHFFFQLTQILDWGLDYSLAHLFYFYFLMVYFWMDWICVLHRNWFVEAPSSYYGCILTNKVFKRGQLWARVGDFVRGEPRELRMLRGKALWWRGRKAATCLSRRDLSLEKELAATLSSDSAVSSSVIEWIAVI
jgi:hypothetical protein